MIWPRKGTILLNNKFESIGEVLKPESFGADIEIEGTFPGLKVQSSGDLGWVRPEMEMWVCFKMEDYRSNRKKPHDKPWPELSQLYLYKLEKN